MALTKKQLVDVCLVNSGDSKTCRYLDNDDNDPSKFYCRKMRPLDKKEVDVEVKDFIRRARADKLDPFAQAAPLGDNCKGYPMLKTLDQGYDVP